MTSPGHNSIQFRPGTLSAIDAVRDSLTLAQARAGASDVTTKDGRDIATAADVANEDAIRAALTARHGFPVIGEERGGDVPADGSPYWLVDPICGTRNYANGMTLWCVNVALIEDGAVVIGVVGDPSTGEVLVAERGRGAWALKDGVERRVATSGDNVTVVIEEGKSKGEARLHAARLMAGVVSADRWDFRSFGTTLALPYLAAGRISAYVVLFVTPLHVAAGNLIVTEAGGVVSDINGAPWTLASDTLLAAANASVHEDLLRIARTAATGSK
jgi:fructose-1,6-bisphosphatase/inositol monophosphatase family enzyme